MVIVYNNTGKLIQEGAIYLALMGQYPTELWEQEVAFSKELKDLLDKGELIVGDQEKINKFRDYKGALEDLSVAVMDYSEAKEAEHKKNFDNMIASMPEVMDIDGNPQPKPEFKTIKQEIKEFLEEVKKSQIEFSETLSCNKIFREIEKQAKIKGIV